MFNWLRELLDIIHDSRDRKSKLIQDVKKCESCEILKIQLERSNLEKERLLSKLLDKPIIEKPNEQNEITVPRMIPWNMRKQMLEEEDRRRAQLMRESVKPDTEELEKELGIAEKERNG